jgi:hypothetical protein
MWDCLGYFDMATYAGDISSCANANYARLGHFWENTFETDMKY